MSSFICTSTHFNSVERGVKSLFNNSNFSWYWAETLIENVSQKGVEDVFTTIRELNVVCYHLQYKNHYEGVLDQEIENTKKYILGNRSKIQRLSLHGLYKSIQCIEYQIEVGHLESLRELTIKEKCALEFLTKLKERIAAYIIQNSKEYDDSSWGIED